MGPIRHAGAANCGDGLAARYLISGFHQYASAVGIEALLSAAVVKANKIPVLSVESGLLHRSVSGGVNRGPSFRADIHTAVPGSLGLGDFPAVHGPHHLRPFGNIRLALWQRFHGQGGFLRQKQGQGIAIAGVSIPHIHGQLLIGGVRHLKGIGHLRDPLRLFALLLQVADALPGAVLQQDASPDENAPGFLALGDGKVYMPAVIADAFRQGLHLQAVGGQLPVPVEGLLLLLCRQAKAGELAVFIDGIELHGVGAEGAVSGVLGDPRELPLVVDAPHLMALPGHGQAVSVQVRVVKGPGEAEGLVGR